MLVAPNSSFFSRPQRLHISRKAAAVFGLAMFVGLATSCAVGVDSTTTAAFSQQSKATETRRTIPRQDKVFAYEAVLAVKAVADNSKPQAFYGSAPYICSPSGFGQKSHCFARATL